MTKKLEELKAGDIVLVKAKIKAVFTESKMVCVAARDIESGFDAYTDEIVSSNNDEENFLVYEPNHEKRKDKVKNVLKGCISKYDIEEITIFSGYVPLYSGSLQNFYSNCDINMVTYRNQLLDKKVIEKSILNNRKLFIFIESEDIQ